MRNYNIRGYGVGAAVALAATVASAEIEIGKGLSITGFLDMSGTINDTDAGTTEALGFDQWEIMFLFDPMEGVSAQVDLNDVDGEDGATIEQAFVNVDLGNGFGLTAGRFLTPHGYEGAEPIYLYQYSVSATIIGYAGYANGVALTYGGDWGQLYVSAVDGSYSGDEDADEISFEAQIKLTPMEGLTLQAAYASEEFAATPSVGDLLAEDFVPGVASYDKGIANFWVEYVTGPLTLAAEYNSLFEIDAPDADGDGYLVMANYAFTDKCALTLRHSGVELDNGFEDIEFTVSPSYAIRDNLLALVEFRTDDFNDDTLDGETYAAELVYTF